MNTLGVALIAKNAETTIKACIESFKDYVDDVVVVMGKDSKDKTRKIVESMGVKVYDFEWVDDFSAARNYSFSKLHTDFMLWVDADDTVLHPENLRKMVDKLDESIGAVWFPYYYAVDEFGNPTVIYERERLLRSKYQWVWRNRVHETVSPLIPCKYVRTEDVIILHNHLAGEPRNDRNFKLLGLMQKESPEDKRVWLYMGHQHFAAQNYEEAAEWYVKFASAEEAAPIEKYQALCYASKALRSVGDAQAINTSLAAIEIQPEYKDAYMELAHGYFMVGDYDKALHWSKQSEGAVEPPGVIFVNPMEYTYNKYLLEAECYLKKGEVDTALFLAEKSYSLRKDTGLTTWINQMKEGKERYAIDQGIKALMLNLLKHGEIVKLHDVEKVIPYWYKDTPLYDEVLAGISKYEIKEDSIVSTDLTRNHTKINLDRIQKPTLPNKGRVLLTANKNPSPETCIKAYSLREMGDLLTNEPGRHILNLHFKGDKLIGEYDHKIPDELAIRFFLGRGFEEWSPDTIIEQGCGGSELSVAWVSEELVKRGCQPIVYAMANGVWDGVLYRKWETFNPSSPLTHLVISSRVPNLFERPIPALQKWLWMHDIHCGETLTPEIAEQLKAIIVLTKWHLNYVQSVYPWLKGCPVIDLEGNEPTFEDNVNDYTFYPEATLKYKPTMVVLSDGVLPKDYSSKVTRIPHRFIWTSSPDRGLKELLEMWAKIREGLPDAELHIFYGWNYFDRACVGRPWLQAYRKELVKLLKQEGVYWRGRVGRKELVKEQKMADVWVYPPHEFRETCCISALEMQMAGVVCIYRMNGALGETVGNRGVGIPLDSTPEQTVKIILDTLQNTKLCDKLRKEGREFASKQSWSSKADKLLSLYKSLE